MKLCHFKVGLDQPFFLIAGPCVIESESLVMETASYLKKLTDDLDIPFIFKASFDKANRSSHQSFRGVGLDKGLTILNKVKKELRIPVLTDVHEYTPLDAVAEVVDILQTPAFLCRQTDYLQRVIACGLPVHLKKGQFLAPWDMIHVVDKARFFGGKTLLVCERGVSFGYNNLVVDMRSLAWLRKSSCPVVFDATHSVQLPGGAGKVSGGNRTLIPVLARAAVAAGIAGLFMETHPDPDRALSDGANSWPLQKMRALLMTLKSIDYCVKNIPFLEQTEDL